MIVYPIVCPIVCPILNTILYPMYIFTLQRFIALLHDLGHATSDACFVSDKVAQARHDRKREDKTQALTLRVTLALCHLEMVLPKGKFTYIMHALRHLPSNIHRWNNVRNFWCYFMERYVPQHPHLCIYIYIYTCICMPHFIISCTHEYVFYYT